ncbi:MAG: DUF4855 domain-containing protein [Armatimonadota bacterium]
MASPQELLWRRCQGSGRLQQMMAGRHSRVLVLALSLALLPALAISDYCPPDSKQSGGMRDIMLVYLAPDSWHEADFLPYVAYLDKAAGGVPRDWFYDSWLFLMFGGAPSGGAYYRGDATKTDWDFYLDLLFAPDMNLAALDACIEKVGRQLSERDRICPVIIMIPYLTCSQINFGDVDGDGKNEDPAREEDRIKALKWCVDAILQRWQQHQYKHLQLWGFYWMNEGISTGDVAAVQATGKYVHGKGYGFHWIPWFMAPGHERGAELGFDFVVMQPNFAFMDTPRGAVVPDEDRLTQNANRARELGLGVEMELNWGVATDLGHRLNLQLYLNHGVDEIDGYMKGAVRAYYQDYDLIAQLYRSDVPACNQLYDDLYHFHKGTYQRRPVSLCEGARATLNGSEAPGLTDGLWLTRDDRTERVLTTGAPAVVEVDLGSRQFVGDVRVHVVARAQGEPVLPSVLRLLTSADGRSFNAAAEGPAPILHSTGDWKGGFALLTCEPTFARKLRVEIDAPEGSRVGVDEVVVFPVPHLLASRAYKISGEMTKDTVRNSAFVLNDGRLALSSQARDAGVGFATGQGTVEFGLDEEWYLAQALAHVRWGGAGQPPSCRVTLTNGGEKRETAWVTAEGAGEAWIEVPLPFVPVTGVSFEVRGPADALWDELLVRRQPNLAHLMPYRVEPPFPAKYPDTDGVELTDGMLSERGFSDGRTVGWFGADVTATVDLGAEKSFDSIAVHTEGGGYAAVEYPTAIEVWVSGDGQLWRIILGNQWHKEVTYSRAVDGMVDELAWLRLAVPSTTARYVRLRFVSRAWLMLSEIEVRSGDQNLAAGCSYFVTPAPESSEKYADDAIRLTDGVYSGPGTGWSKAVGWDKGTPEVVVDLLHPRQVSLVRVHVLGGGHGAVYFPRCVAVATSLDGEQWTEETETRSFPEESGSESLVAFMSVPLTPREARYVRLRLERKGWAMLDEVEVY